MSGTRSEYDESIENVNFHPPIEIKIKL